MIELDPSKLSPEVATILFGRGAGIPPLEWHPRADRTAKRQLDALADATLVRNEPVADEAMLAALRAMLYLWNGWIDDCRMYVEGAPDPERYYLTGICERQVGQPIAAKAAFQQLEGHPVFESLAAKSAEIIGIGADPVVDRFAQMLKLGEAWEPFAFIDVFEQARASKLSQASTHIVCAVQCLEFELLFMHAYAAAVGKAVPLQRQKDAPASPRPKRRGTKPRRNRRENATPSAMGEADRSETRPAEAPPTHPPMIAICCPKCTARLRVPGEGRGAKARCNKCGAVFLVPQEHAQSADANRE